MRKVLVSSNNRSSVQTIIRQWQLEILLTTARWDKVCKDKDKAVAVPLLETKANKKSIRTIETCQKVVKTRMSHLLSNLTNYRQ